jgi:acetylglutamate kinase
MLSNKIPAAVRLVLYSACPTALSNKDRRIRAIAVSSVVRRLTRKVASPRLIKKVGSALQAAQLGYRTRGSLEAVVDVAGASMADSNKTKVMLKLDFETLSTPFIAMQ